MSSYGPHRTFPAPFLAQPSVRHRQDSDVHSSKYDSAAESSIYESPWFSSSSQSLVSPGSPQSGYYSTGSVNDLPRAHFVRHDGRTRHRATHSYTFGAGMIPPPAPGFSSGFNAAAKTASSSLGMRASSEEASVAPVKQEAHGEEDTFEGDMEVVGSEDDSEYLEGHRSLAGAVRKRPRKLKTAGIVDDGEESVRDVIRILIFLNADGVSLRCTTGICRHARTWRTKAAFFT